MSVPRNWSFYLERNVVPKREARFRYVLMSTLTMCCLYVNPCV